MGGGVSKEPIEASEGYSLPPDELEDGDGYDANDDGGEGKGLEKEDEFSFSPPSSAPQGGANRGGPGLGGDLEEVKEDTNNSPSKGGGGGFFSNMFHKEEVVDPPLPYLGPPTGYFKILDRTKKARIACKNVLELVDLDAVDSVMEGKIIPTHPDKERIAVTADVEQRISQKRSKKAIKLENESNILDIQKSLYWKKMLIEMMNFNFHKVKVRKTQYDDHKENRTGKKFR